MDWIFYYICNNLNVNTIKIILINFNSINMKIINTKNYFNSSLIFFLFIILSAGCSTENNVTTVVPANPTNLSANLISTTQVNLTWTDNATNETGYKVQRKITGGNFADIASTGSDISIYNDLGLSINTTYIYRVYSYNSAGNSPLYSNEVTIATISIPIINTNPVDSITPYTVICGGNVISDNGSAVTTRGVCWSTSTAPDISLQTKTNDGAGVGNFRSHISGLIPNTTYYIRAYATNSLGTAYGNEINFNTPIAPSLPTIITSSIAAISSTSATSGGNISTDGGSPVTSKGVCWSTSTGPTTALSTKTNDGSGIGLFGSNLTGLSPYTTYYVRSYATNSVGTAYGNELSFTTLDIPSLTTSTITNILSNSATGGGNIVNDGGSSVTSRGVCWSTLPSPNISLSTKTIDGSGTGNFSSSLTSLNPNTTYYVRAYATNSIGTAYGNEVSFTTISLPSITTTSVFSITAYTASSGGIISNNGGSAVTSRGVCWSTSVNPTISLSTKTIDGSGSGPFSSSITGLSPNTTYHVRAYATNGVGTAYGADEVFTTLQISLPTVITTNAISITNSSSISGGNVTFSGNLPITARGVCWSTSPNPNVALSTKTIDGSGVGTFTSNITYLTANTLYYVRAYATNSLGTSYGTEITFTTLPLSLGQTYAGGIIFYIDNTNQHGLVCAPSDQGRVPWGCRGSFLSGTSSIFGSGSNNTSLILAGCNTSNIAAKLCDDLTLGGYTDWFLPSMDELRLMYNNLQANGIGNFNTMSVGGSCYWSSTEADPIHAYLIWFSDGNDTFYQMTYYEKSYNNFVRAVRSF